jgi:hypothetical protein
VTPEERADAVLKRILEMKVSQVSEELVFNILANHFKEAAGSTPTPTGLEYAAVVGRGEFPYDMLRYDQCWPASEQRDVPQMNSVYEDYRYCRIIIVARRRDLNRAWTSERWTSFGWSLFSAVGMGEYSLREEATKRFSSLLPPKGVKS